jgi:hypothetical protein
MGRERLISRMRPEACVWSALLGSVLAACAAQPAQPPQGLTEATCRATTCKIEVDASACQTGGHPAVDIGKIHIKGNKNIQIVWEVQHAAYEFRLGRSLLLKDARGDPTGQFSGKFLLGQNDQPDPSLKRGKKMQWLDANIVVDNNEYPYHVILFDAADNTCALDPVIVNDG